MTTSVRADMFQEFVSDRASKNAQAFLCGKHYLHMRKLCLRGKQFNYTRPDRETLQHRIADRAVFCSTRGVNYKNIQTSASCCDLQTP